MKKLSIESKVSPGDEPYCLAYCGGEGPRWRVLPPKKVVRVVVTDRGIFAQFETVPRWAHSYAVEDLFETYEEAKAEAAKRNAEVEAKRMARAGK